MKAGTIKRVHVNRHVMAKNMKTGSDDPIYTVQTSKGPMSARRLEIHGHIIFDQSMKKLGCGARAYGVTKAAIEVTA